MKWRTTVRAAAVDRYQIEKKASGVLNGNGSTNCRNTASIYGEKSPMRRNLELGAFEKS